MKRSIRRRTATLSLALPFFVAGCGTAQIAGQMQSPDYPGRHVVEAEVVVISPEQVSMTAGACQISLSTSSEFRQEVWGATQSELGDILGDRSREIQTIDVTIDRVEFHNVPGTFRTAHYISAEVSVGLNIMNTIDGRSIVAGRRGLGRSTIAGQEEVANWDFCDHSLQAARGALHDAISLALRDIRRFDLPADLSD